MRRIAPCAFIALALGSQSSAQSPSPDEKAIREIITRLNGGERFPTPPDMVFWSAAYERPIGPGEPAKAAPGAEKRMNQKQVVDVKRIEVAGSGDLAYEYSHFEASWDLADKTHVEREGAIVRVWKKVKGEWVVALWFQHPYGAQAPK